MTRSFASIEFEHRYEIESLLTVIEKYIDTYPREKDNQALKEFYYLLDAMDMEW